MRPPVPLTPPRPRRRRKPLYFPPHTSALHSTVAVVFSEPVAVTRLARHRTAGHAARGVRDRKHLGAPPPPRAARPAGPPTRLVRSCGAGYAGGAACWGRDHDASCRARPPTRASLEIATSLHGSFVGPWAGGRRGVRPKATGTDGGRSGGRHTVGLVGSLAALPLQDVDVLHATTGARLHLQVPFTPLLQTCGLGSDYAKKMRSWVKLFLWEHVYCRATLNR